MASGIDVMPGSTSSTSMLGGQHLHLVSQRRCDWLAAEPLEFRLVILR